MAILNSNKNETVEQGIFTFHKGVVECRGESKSGKNKMFNKIFNKKEEMLHFIQISQIARVWKADLPMERWLLYAAITILLLSLLVMSQIWFMGLLLLGIAVACGYFYFTSRRYMLLIETSSSGLYSFISPEEEYVRKGYDMILDFINKREDERSQVVYNISTGQVQTFVAGDHSKVGV